MAYQRGTQKPAVEKGKPRKNSSLYLSHHGFIFQTIFFLLTWAMPPTNLVFTTTLSSSLLSNAAFWAALTRLSEARFTALPAACKRGTPPQKLQTSPRRRRRSLQKRLLYWSYLKPPDGLRVLVGLHLAGHQQLSRGGRHLLGRRDELLLAGVALHRGVGRLAQVAGGRCDHASLQRGSRRPVSRSEVFNLSKWQREEDQDVRLRWDPETTGHRPPRWLGWIPPEESVFFNDLASSDLHPEGRQMWAAVPNLPLRHQLPLGGRRRFDQSARRCGDGLGCFQDLLLKVQRLIRLLGGESTLQTISVSLAAPLLFMGNIFRLGEKGWKISLLSVTFKARNCRLVQSDTVLKPNLQCQSERKRALLLSFGHWGR